MGKEVAEAASTDLAINPAFDDYAGAGTETATADDYAIPFIKIVQKASPVIDENPEARPGMFLNTVSGDLYDSLLLIPCGFKREYVQWADRDSGEGIRGTHPIDTPLLEECVPDEKGVPTFPAEHEFATDQLIETRYHYCMVIVPATGEYFPALISMTSTQHKRSKRWMSLMSARKLERSDGKKIDAPTFAFMYHATTVQESKDQYTWYSWVITTGKMVEDVAMAEDCIKFYKSVLADDVKVSEETRD